MTVSKGLDKSNVKLQSCETKVNKKTRSSRENLFVKPDEPQICSVCSENCTNVNTLIKHRAHHHGPKKFQCQTCGKKNLFLN